MTDARTHVDGLADGLRARLFAQRPDVSDEHRLQEAVQEALGAVTEALAVESLPRLHIYRELHLSKRDRLDFLVGYSPLWSATAIGMAVEVKIQGSLSDLTRQLFRYAEHEQVTGLVLVTTRNRLARGHHDVILGKPLAVVNLADLLL